jgi:chemotaxis response regulator CheB
VNSVKSQALSQVEERKKQVDGLKKTAEQKVAQVGSSSGGAGKALEGLKKKLPF